MGDGLDTPEGIAIIKDIKSLRRLTLTNCKVLKDDDVKMVASITQLEQLELGGIELTDERLPLLQDFAFLKALRIVKSGTPFTPEMKEKIKTLLPKVAIKFE